MLSFIHYLFREGVKKSISYEPVCNVLSPQPPIREKAFFCGLLIFLFFFIFRYAFKKMQKWSNKYVFDERKKNFGSKGKILSIFYENVVF